MNPEVYNQLNQSTRGAIETIKLAYNSIDCYGNRQSVMLAGQPGVGKTAISRIAAKELGLNCLVISPSAHDVIDVKLPYVHKRTKFLGRKKIGTEKVAAHAIGDILPRKGKWLILIDDITNAPIDMQATLYSLVYEGTLGSCYKIPEGSFVCAAGNRVFDKTNSSELSAALKDRLITINVIPDRRVWLDDFAYANNVNYTVTSWLEGVSEKSEDKFIEGFDATDPAGGLTPRSAYRLSTLLNNNIHSKIDKCALFKGVIGQKAGHDFDKYYNNREVFDNVRKILNGQPYDSNIEHSTMYMITNALAAAVDKTTIKNAEKFFKKECTEEKLTFAATKIHMRDKTLFGNRFFKTVYLEASPETMG